MTKRKPKYFQKYFTKNSVKNTGETNLALSLLIGVFLLIPFLNAAESQANLLENESNDSTEMSEISENPAESDQSVSEETLRKQYNTQSFLSGLRNEMKNSEADLLAINNTVEETEEKLDQTRKRIGTLHGQIMNLDEQIKNTEQMIKNVEEQIYQKEGEIKHLEYQIAIKKVEIANQKQLFLEYLEVIYKQQNNFNSFAEQELELNTLKLLFGDDAAGETLRALKYSEILEENGREIFSKLSLLVEEDELNQKLLTIKRQTLGALQIKLADEKEDLQIQKRAKGALLKQTRGEEKVYQELLENSKKQQEEVLLEVETLRENLAFIERKAQELGANFDPANYASLFDGVDNSKILDFLNEIPGDGEIQLRWPVSPSRGITAYFREASYAQYFGMQHNAIDVRAYQNTPIRAPADGIVYKAADNGYGYSYVILAHQNGFMTVFGHVTKIMVKPGQMIQAGETVGLSGGAPGTLGAGVYTTGAHLHFEVMKDGKYVDPLNYLNLSYVKLESLPEKYVAKALGDKQKVRRNAVESEVYSNSELTQLVELGELSHAVK